MTEQNRSAKAYARALFKNGLALQNSEINTTESSLISLGEELVLIRALILNSLKLKALLTNPTFPDEKKVALLLNFFPKMSKIMCSFLRVLSERSQLKNIFIISEEYYKILSKFNATTTVTLILASPLEESLGPYLLTALKKLTTSKEVILKPIFSPKLLGGLIIEYNSKAIDASIANEIYKFI